MGYPKQHLPHLPIWGTFLPWTLIISSSFLYQTGCLNALLYLPKLMPPRWCNVPLHPGSCTNNPSWSLWKAVRGTVPLHRGHTGKQQHMIRRASGGTGLYWKQLPAGWTTVTVCLTKGLNGKENGNVRVCEVTWTAVWLNASGAGNAGIFMLLFNVRKYTSCSASEWCDKY